MNNVKKRLDKMQNQIFKNLVQRGLVAKQDERMIKAELSVYRFHIWKIIFEELSEYFKKHKKQDELL